MDEDLEEIRALLRTLDVDVEKEFIQKRNEPHIKTFLGPGRVEEIQEDISNDDIDYVVINGDLKPSQHHALEMIFQKECVDRIGVILRIFSQNAHTEEAKNQVTLATLRYELPFLREWIHKAKSGERPGFLSGGAYATDVYYEHSRSHIRRIEMDLDLRSKQREIRRMMRRRKGYYLVSLAGYTNAGKSALLNALSASDELVDDRLFSTLTTTTRLVTRSRRRILLTDTVGFIRNLPPNLVDAFNSTLEEIFLADLILVVVDVSESLETIEEKLRTTLNVLLPKLNGRRVVILGNKVDKIPVDYRPRVETALLKQFPSSRVVFVSAIGHTGLDDLVNVIESCEGRDHLIRATLPMTDESLSLISELHDSTDVEEVTLGELVKIEVCCRSDEAQKLVARIKSVGGDINTDGQQPEDEFGP